MHLRYKPLNEDGNGNPGPVIHADATVSEGNSDIAFGDSRSAGDILREEDAGVHGIKLRVKIDILPSFGTDQ